MCASCALDSTRPNVDFDVLTTVTPSIAGVGDSVLVTATAVNISDRPVEILTNSCITAFAVLDSAGKLVGPASEQFCLMNAIAVTLAPGERYSTAQVWHGDAVRQTLDAPPAVVKPGTYTVRGNLGIGDRVRTIPATVRLSP